MKYSLRSLMIAALVLPPLLAWGGMPIYRWLTTPKPPSPLSITPLQKPKTTAPPVIAYDAEVYGVQIGYPSPERWEEILAKERLRKSSAPAPNPSKP